MKKYLVKKIKSDNKGFSLVELIIIIAIMALLVAIIVPNFLEYLDKARKTRDLEMARVLGTALERVIALDPECCKQWEQIGKSGQNSVYFNVLDHHTGQNYKVYNGFEWTLTREGDITYSGTEGNFRNGVLRDPYGANAHKLLYDAYVDELAQYDINIFYRKHNIGQYRILKREGDGRIEVWVCPVRAGTDGEGITNGFVYYRLYPDYDPRYMTNRAFEATNANGRGGSL
ncbi:MAG: prepilin-type N-terminal cleavage/methylation domain-containing protein [Lachnospiraceae bacterium]|nr:prepilin-type N-terminal cleavage/methylation domain-containing protein [Lachnospiraceae bacterium]